MSAYYYSRHIRHSGGTERRAPVQYSQAGCSVSVQRNALPSITVFAAMELLSHSYDTVTAHNCQATAIHFMHGITVIIVLQPSLVERKQGRLLVSPTFIRKQQ